MGLFRLSGCGTTVVALSDSVKSHGAVLTYTPKYQTPSPAQAGMVIWYLPLPSPT